MSELSEHDEHMAFFKGERQMLAEGYREVLCEDCRGRLDTPPCPTCSGRGWVWEAPER